MVFQPIIFAQPPAIVPSVRINMLLTMQAISDRLRLEVLQGVVDSLEADQEVDDGE